MLSVAAPMSLLGHLTNGAHNHDHEHSHPEVHIFHFNRTVHLTEEEPQFSTEDPRIVQILENLG